MKRIQNLVPSPRGTAGLVLTAGLVSCVATAEAAQDVTADEVVAKIREAVGWEALERQKAGLMVIGECHEGGLDGGFTTLFTPAGRFVHRTSTELGAEEGYDGETAWRVDSTGLPRVLALGSRDSSRCWSWITTGTWLDPESDRFDVVVDESQSDDTVLGLDLRLSGTPFTATLLVDRESWLPTALVRKRAGGSRRTDLRDWRTVNGFRYPHEIEITEVAGDVSTYRATSVRPSPTFILDPYTAPPTRPDDTTFDGEAAAGIETRRARTGHVLVHPKVNGKDVGWFLLDSGAGATCIDPKVADSLEMSSLGVVSVVGVGGAQQGGFRKGATLEAGPMKIEGLVWLELDLSFLEPFFGVEVAGVLGYDVFARSVVRLDLEGEEVEFHDPAGFGLDSGTWRELRLDGATPCVEASFAGGHTDWFRLDTGSDDTVTFNGPAVERYELTKGRDNLRDVRLGGVGGSTKAKQGSVRWFELGGEKFEHPIVTYADPEGGALANDYIAGNIGSGLMEAFELVFDYGRGRVAFLPRGGDE